MSTSIRALSLSVLCVVGAGLIAALYWTEASTPLRSSLAPAFQLLGHSTKVVDGLLARVMPVDSVDEADLGRVIAAGYEQRANLSDPSYVYLNHLVRHQAGLLKRPFAYRAFVLEQAQPNAMALPGGVILVTRGLLNTMTSEAELMGVLAHEFGHIELGHCFDGVKFELLTRKVTRASYGRIADIAVNMLLHHSFSKTQEDQADEYAFAFLVETAYDPRGMSGAFDRLMQSQGGQVRQASHANPIRDYFMSHPPLALRRAKFAERANAWWRTNPAECRLNGAANLTQRQTFYVGMRNPLEWVGYDTTDSCTGTM